jgi:hypothetical protein
VVSVLIFPVVALGLVRGTTRDTPRVALVVE